MQLKIWKPFLDLDREWPPLPSEWMTEFKFRPSVDLVRTDGELVVTAELPGMSPDDVEVSIDDDVLVIKGEKAEEREVDEEDRYLKERSYGKFQRRIALPSGTSADKVTADYDKGILTVRVTLPEDGELTPRHIPVTVKSA